ncbi:MAG: signal peptidase I [Oscillospiraceae bacterium]|nr:signal peptidase I [Oscillospiraceae bacterium]
MSADKKKNHRSSRIISAVLYTVLALAVIAALIWRFAGDNSGPRQIAGYSGFFVLTDSMYPELPPDSLVITRRTDPAALNVGDNITFFVDEDTTATHKIIEVLDDGAELRFRTKGVNSDRADYGSVAAQSVIGRVVFHSLFLGTVLKYFITKPWMIAVFVVALVAISLLLRYGLRGKPNTVVSEDAAEVKAEDKKTADTR